jgi:hypothetical protein
MVTSVCQQGAQLDIKTVQQAQRGCAAFNQPTQGLTLYCNLTWRVLATCPAALLQDVRGDIFAFGLCMLELLTLKQLDPQHCLEVPQLLQQVRGVEAMVTCQDMQ